MGSPAKDSGSPSGTNNATGGGFRHSVFVLVKFDETRTRKKSPQALTLPLGGFRHSVFVLVKFDDRDKKSVYSNFKTKTKAFLKHPPCLKRGSRDELLGDGNLLKQYVGTCELNKCIKRPQQTKKNKNKKKQKQKQKKTKTKTKKTKTKTKKTKTKKTKTKKNKN